MSREGEGSDESDAHTSQGMPGIARSYRGGRNQMLPHSS